MTFDIRRATRADLPALIDLHRAFCTVDQHPFSEARAHRAFNGLVDDDSNGVVWIVDDRAAHDRAAHDRAANDRAANGHAAGHRGGYAVLTWGWSIEAGGREAVLDEIFVSERNTGLGSALIEHLVNDARQRRIARIFLETESHNERVRRLYARAGFVADDSVWMSLDFTDLS